MVHSPGGLIVLEPWETRRQHHDLISLSVILGWVLTCDGAQYGDLIVLETWETRPSAP